MPSMPRTPQRERSPVLPPELWALHCTPSGSARSSSQPRRDIQALRPSRVLTFHWLYTPYAAFFLSYSSMLFCVSMSTPYSLCRPTVHSSPALLQTCFHFPMYADTLFYSFPRTPHADPWPQFRNTMHRRGAHTSPQGRSSMTSVVHRRRRAVLHPQCRATRRSGARTNVRAPTKRAHAPAPIETRARAAAPPD
ncbi:hypothetical protein C8J57DRAFT_1307983 [Mycena rebaudengoi]|nr:hypothetical protein C8J57DRAFT_1307983 [Mycena rebaudengoi]